MTANDRGKTRDSVHKPRGNFRGHPRCSAGMSAGKHEKIVHTLLTRKTLVLYEANGYCYDIKLKYSVLQRTTASGYQGQTYSSKHSTRGLRLGQQPQPRVDHITINSIIGLTTLPSISIICTSAQQGVIHMYHNSVLDF